MGDLDGVTVAFDLDNTLLDPTGERYLAITSEFLSHVDLGLDCSLLAECYERVRRWGPVLSRLGFANVLHDRGHVDGLAVLALLFAAQREAFLKHQEKRDAWIALLNGLDALARGTRRGSPEDRLDAERTLRESLVSDEAIAFCRAVRELSQDEQLLRAASSYPAIEDAHPVDDVCAMLRNLIDRGANCVVISQGRSANQREKVARLGIDRLLSGKVLITQDARRIDGYESLDDRIDSLFANGSDESLLRQLWVYRCLLDLWGSKSPWFYGRCLHALHAGGGNVEKRLRSLTTIAEDRWSSRPLRFVMIGDRYEKDVLPLIDLLGCGGACTVHLCTGKYNEGFECSKLPEFTRPTHSFGSMRAVRDFLDNELRPDSIQPVVSSPPIAPDGWFEKGCIEFGSTSDLSCVRAISRALSAV